MNQKNCEIFVTKKIPADRSRDFSVWIRQSRRRSSLFLFSFSSQELPDRNRTRGRSHSAGHSRFPVRSSRPGARNFRPDCSYPDYHNCLPGDNRPGRRSHSGTGSCFQGRNSHSVAHSYFSGRNTPPAAHRFHPENSLHFQDDTHSVDFSHTEDRTDSAGHYNGREPAVSGDSGIPAAAVQVHNLTGVLGHPGVNNIQHDSDSAL